VSSHQSANTELFHYICFVPINNHLYELDGLQPHPIDHGKIADRANWTEKFKQIIHERISLTQSNGETTPNGLNGHLLNQNTSEIRYSLMALVPDKIKLYEGLMKTLHANQTKLLNIIDNKDQM
jgi:ubiquitin carboxyl-terminal hydrolase BAP1